MARALIGILLLLGASGCTPSAHAFGLYKRDPAAAEKIETRAAELCSEWRGAESVPPHVFKTDGCSMWFDGGWVECCVEHDIRYWCGGDREERARADREFRECVRTQRGGDLVYPMYLGVRVGAMGWMPLPWRWGYGWGWPAWEAPCEEDAPQR